VLLAVESKILHVHKDERMTAQYRKFNLQVSLHLCEMCVKWYEGAECHCKISNAVFTT